MERTLTKEQAINALRSPNKKTWVVGITYGGIHRVLGKENIPTVEADNYRAYYEREVK